MAISRSKIDRDWYALHESRMITFTRVLFIIILCFFCVTFILDSDMSFVIALPEITRTIMAFYDPTRQTSLLSINNVAISFRWPFISLWPFNHLVLSIFSVSHVMSQRPYVGDVQHASRVFAIVFCEYMIKIRPEIGRSRNSIALFNFICASNNRDIVTRQR